MEEKKLEEKIDEMLAEAAKMADEEPTETDTLNTVDDKEIVFSRKHERRMKKIFVMAEKYEKVQRKLEREIEKIDERADKRHLKMAKNEAKAKIKAEKKALADKIKADKETNATISKFYFNSRNIAITCAMILLIGIFMIPSSGAWRRNIAKIFFKPKEKYSEFNNVKTNENTAEVEGIKFNYVPKGFAFEEVRDFYSMKIISFYNEEKDKFFDLKISEQTFDIKINTESGEIKDISTDDRDMILVKNDREMYVTWQDAKNVYVLDGNCDEETLKKIAGNMEFVQK